MEKKILVEVYGVKDGTTECNCCSGDCDCNCNCDCGSTSCSSIGEMYDNLVGYFERSTLKDKVTLRFIDIAKEEFDNYGTIADMLERGFEPPFIAIDKEIKLYGSIFNEMIYEYVEEALDNENDL